MPQIVCSISLDVGVSDSGLCLMAKSGDYGSRRLSVQLTDCGAPIVLGEDVSVLLNISKQGERKSFTGVVSEKGEADFVLPAFLLECAGTAKCDVSVVDAVGNRLTSAVFEVAVEESVCPGEGVSADENPDVVAQLLASERVYELSLSRLSDRFLLAPLLNRKYTVDLSDAALVEGNTWKHIELDLPTPRADGEESWVLLYCHAPVSEAAGPVVIDWGDATERLFADGLVPTINMGDFDVVCIYSHAQGKWQIGVVQYGTAEASV